MKFSNVTANDFEDLLKDVDLLESSTIIVGTIDARVSQFDNCGNAKIENAQAEWYNACPVCLRVR